MRSYSLGFYSKVYGSLGLRGLICINPGKPLAWGGRLAGLGYSAFGIPLKTCGHNITGFLLGILTLVPLGKKGA